MGAWERGSDLANDRLGDTFRIFRDLAVPEADDSPAEGLEEGGALEILGNLVEMLGSVDLNRQLDLAAGEIEYVASDDELAREAAPMMADERPDLSLVAGGAVAQRAGPLRATRRNPWHGDPI